MTSRRRGRPPHRRGPGLPGFDDHLAEVTRHTEAMAGRSTVPAIRDGRIHRLGIPVPALRRAVAAGYSFVSASRPANLTVWDYIWRHSAYEEVMHQALYFYQRQELNREEARTIRGWADRCTNWRHADDLAKIYATVVEAHPAWIVPALRRWNHSGNPWMRRLSVVSLIEYAGRRKRFLAFEELIAFVEPLLDDEDYYVQKGLGWTLREIGTAYPRAGRAFLERHAARLAPQAWTSATKKLEPFERARLRAIREAGRR